MRNELQRLRFNSVRQEPQSGAWCLWRHFSEVEPEMNEVVESLMNKAKQAQNADDALKYSQAACNVANAIGREKDTELRK